MRLTCRQEFVIGGYTPSHLGLDALLVSFYQGKELRFAGSVRAGLTPLTRREVHDQIKDLEIARYPFANLPDKRAGAWRQGITSEKMRLCRWLMWSAAFVCFRHDKNARKVIREV